MGGAREGPEERAADLLQKRDGPGLPPPGAPQARRRQPESRGTLRCPWARRRSPAVLGVGLGIRFVVAPWTQLDCHTQGTRVRIIYLSSTLRRGSPRPPCRAPSRLVFIACASRH